MYFTACQIQLRKVNPKLQFSYDASTPFMLAGMMDKYATPPAFTSDAKSWSVGFEKLDAVQTNAHSMELAFKHNTSPLGKLIEMRHLVIHKQKFKGRRVDNISNQLMANHNIWVYLDASQRIYDLAFSTQQDRTRIPDKLLQALQVVEEAFTVEKPLDFINTNKAILDSAAKMQYKQPDTHGTQTL